MGRPDAGPVARAVVGAPAMIADRIHVEHTRPPVQRWEQMVAEEVQERDRESIREGRGISW